MTIIAIKISVEFGIASYAHAHKELLIGMLTEFKVI